LRSGLFSANLRLGMQDKYQYIFGPVPSRRLGRSLGIDLIPYKTCSFNCVYCQIGETYEQTIKRAEYAPTKEVLKELEKKLEEHRTVDYLTFSGSGEPTLHSGIGAIIRKVKRLFMLPVAVITNGSLLWMKEVQKDLAEADVVLPTLSTISPEKYQMIHRPRHGLELEKIIEGMIGFRKKFNGQIWLEIFIVKGINDSDDDMEKLKSVLERIKPDRIQLNTSLRRPSQESSLAVSEKEMIHLARILGGQAEVIADFRGKRAESGHSATEQDLLNYLKRRPGTVNEICIGLGIEQELAQTLLRNLLDQNLVSFRKCEEREEYYFVPSRIRD